MLPERLEKIQIPPGALGVLEQLQHAGFQAFLVGGCVRDMLRGLAPKDYDVTTSALPEQVQKLFPKVIPTGVQHGTVTVVHRGMSIEVTTFRSEGSYIDGRRPTSVEFHQDVREDLARRDFTINAMALDPLSRCLVDPFDGQADLSAGVIRAVGNPFDRFSEDGLRSLRAVRFAAVLGFALESDTEIAIPKTLEIFKKVSVERIRDEFTKLLLSERAESGLKLLARTGLLPVFLPELITHLETVSMTVPRSPRVLDVRLAVLFHKLDDAQSRAMLARLKYPNKVMNQVLIFLKHRPDVESADTEAKARRAVSSLGRDSLEGVFELIEALEGASNPGIRTLYAQALRGNPPLTVKDLALSGRDLMRLLTVQPGPVVGHATRHLMDFVLEHPQLNSVDALTSELRRWKTENMNHFN